MKDDVKHAQRAQTRDLNINKNLIGNVVRELYISCYIQICCASLMESIKLTLNKNEFSNIKIFQMCMQENFLWDKISINAKEQKKRYWEAILEFCS